MPCSRTRRFARPGRALGTLVVAAGIGFALTACSSPADTDTDTAAGEETRTVTHARGTTEVPADPQRIVVLEPVQLDTAVALGRPPVGATVLSEKTGLPAYLGDSIEDTATVGRVPDPNIEQIAALDPDLILGTETRNGELYESLSAIAPTVFMASHTDPWQDSVRVVADALGDPSGADRLLTAYEDRCDQVAAEFDTVGRTAQFVRPRNDLLTLYGPTSFAGSTLECAGFTIPPRDWEDSISVDLSPELAAEARADLVLVSSTEPGDRGGTVPAAMAAYPDLFADLHLVDHSLWITGVGPLGGMAALDDLSRILGTANQ